MYVEGSGCLHVRRTVAEGDSSYVWKDITADGDVLLVEGSPMTGVGLDFEDDVILSYPSSLISEVNECEGSGISDNLYFLPKISLVASFKEQPITITAEFQVG